ncbi:DUF2252 family protein [Paraburkholderia youngii]|uniref:DUF2252 family protein n=1 Tax=Paraburkholderia youngii TaxID=2782701 RepID=UPI003D1D546F
MSLKYRIVWCSAQFRIKDEPPLIFRLTDEMAPGLAKGYSEAIASYRKSLDEHVRVAFDRFHLVDMARP